MFYCLNKDEKDVCGYFDKEKNRCTLASLTSCIFASEKEETLSENDCIIIDSKKYDAGILNENYQAVVKAAIEYKALCEKYYIPANSIVAGVCHTAIQLKEDAQFYGAAEERERIKSY